MKINLENLPELTGTEKQVSYADDLRRTYITRPSNNERRERYLKAVEDAQNPAVLAKARASKALAGVVDEELPAAVLAMFCKKAGLGRMMAAYTETSASKIIDALSGF